MDRSNIISKVESNI